MSPANHSVLSTSFDHRLDRGQHSPKLLEPPQARQIRPTRPLFPLVRNLPVRLRIHPSSRAFSFSLRSVAFFRLGGTLNAMGGIRDGVKTGLGNLSTALLALSEAAVFDPRQCPVDLVDGVLVASQQTKREFLVGVVTAKLGHAGWHASGPAVVLVQGVVFHLRHIAQEPGPQGQESLAI
jgi:hypothetical protein